MQDRPVRVAVIFFGIVRSLESTIASIRRNVYDCNPDVSLFTLASLNLPRVISNPRSGETAVVPKHEDVFRLGADFYALVPQDDTAIAPFLAAAQRQPDLFENDWASIRNLLHQLVSLQRAWAICTTVLGGFDHYLFIRPDLEYLGEIRIRSLVSGFHGSGNIALPVWNSWGGFNDRFALADAAAAAHYAQRLTLVDRYCVTRSLHGEMFLGYALERGGCKVAALPVRARRIRADGRVHQENFDAKVIHLPDRPERFTQARGEILLKEEGSPAPAKPVQPGLRPMIVDGFLRVAPLGGPHYLSILGQLHSRRRVARYLEIGTQSGGSLKRAVGQAIAIDPEFRLDKAEWGEKPSVRLFEMTSDAFFAAHDPCAILGGPIDLAFIDGMHLAEYVLRDFVNVERHCDRGSLIVLHDAIPGNFEMTERHRRTADRRDKALANAWTGDVWRVLPILQRERPDLQIQILDCEPTGLVLIGNLDPDSHRLSDRLEEHVRALRDVPAQEMDFWVFLASATVTDARTLRAEP
jgi:hypothetical protein